MFKSIYEYANINRYDFSCTDKARVYYYVYLNDYTVIQKETFWNIYLADLKSMRKGVML